MKTTILTLATALALGALAGCERERNAEQAAGAGGSAPQSTYHASTPSTPANLGAPQSQEEKKDGANPTQQQVDPKQGEQHRDFRLQGDGAGPRGPDTEPKSGG